VTCSLTPAALDRRAALRLPSWSTRPPLCLPACQPAILHTLAQAFRGSLTGSNCVLPDLSASPTSACARTSSEEIRGHSLNRPFLVMVWERMNGSASRRYTSVHSARAGADRPDLAAPCHDLIPSSRTWSLLDKPGVGPMKHLLLVLAFTLSCSAIDDLPPIESAVRLLNLRNSPPPRL